MNALHCQTIAGIFFPVMFFQVSYTLLVGFMTVVVFMLLVDCQIMHEVCIYVCVLGRLSNYARGVHVTVFVLQIEGLSNTTSTVFVLQIEGLSNTTGVIKYCVCVAERVL